MATTTAATKNIWTDFAILEPSSPQFNKRGEPVKWKVQINQFGGFRCGCPSFIFGKVVPRSCKHTRRCELEQGKPMTVSVPKPIIKPAETPITHPQYASAVTICTAMLDESRVKVSEDQMHKMCAVLATKLAAFGAAPAPMRTATLVTQKVAVGVRYITFDE